MVPLVIAVIDWHQWDPMAHPRYSQHSTPSQESQEYPCYLFVIPPPKKCVLGKSRSKETPKGLSRLLKNKEKIDGRDSLPSRSLTAKAPENEFLPNKERIVFQPPFFRGKLAVKTSGGGGNIMQQKNQAPQHWVSWKTLLSFLVYDMFWNTRVFPYEPAPTHCTIQLYFGSYVFFLFNILPLKKTSVFLHLNWPPVDPLNGPLRCGVACVEYVRRQLWQPWLWLWCTLDKIETLSCINVMFLCAKLNHSLNGDPLGARFIESPTKNGWWLGLSSSLVKIPHG